MHQAGQAFRGGSGGLSRDRGIPRRRLQQYLGLVQIRIENVNGGPHDQLHAYRSRQMIDRFRPGNQLRQLGIC